MMIFACLSSLDSRISSEGFLPRGGFLPHVTLRYTLWASKMANTKLTSAPKLKSLPPTNESFVEHVRRAHHQTAIWKGSLSPDPPQMDPVQYGWSRGEDNSTVSPIMLPANVSPVPVDVLQMIKWGCYCSPTLH